MKSSDFKFLIFIFAAFPLLNLAQTLEEHNTNHGLRLIPQPQKVMIKPGLFEWHEGISIVLSKNAEKSEEFAAMQLADEIEAVLGEKPSIQDRGRGIYLGLIGRDHRLARDFGKEDLQLGNEGYFIEIQKDRIICLSNTSQGLFYAVQTLKQLIRANMSLGILPQLRIMDWPAFPLRGWSEEAADTSMPNMAFLKRRLRVNSEFKMNYYSLYLKNNNADHMDTDALIEYAEAHHIQMEIINCFDRADQALFENNNSFVYSKIENSGVWPDFQSHIADAAAITADGFINNASGMLFGVKVINGESLLVNDWFPMIWASETAWNPVIPNSAESKKETVSNRLRKFDLSFDPLFFHHEGYEITGLMHMLSRLSGLHSPIYLFTKERNEQASTSADSLYLHMLHEEAKAIAGELKIMINRAGRLKDVVSAAYFAAKTIQVFAGKKLLENEVAVSAEPELTNHYRQNLLSNQIDSLVSDILALKQEYIDLWSSERNYINAHHIDKYDRLAEYIMSLMN